MKTKKWLAAEEDYLQENWGIKSLKHLASKLGKTENAVIIKVARMGLGPYLENGDYVSYNQLLSALFNLSNDTPYRINKRWVGFPIKHKKVRKNRFRVVYLDDFWKWAEKNKRLIDFSKMEEGSLCAEPEWVKKKRKIDFECRRLTTPWTNADDQKLEYMLNKKCYTYIDFARELHRTEDSIRRRIYDLALDARPVRAKARKWTAKEEEKLKKLYDEGWSLDVIGIKLNRTGQSVRGKIQLVQNPDMYLRKNRRKVNEC